ncbi:glucose 1-dehydrogenase [Chitinophaga polysaccharea]|uniref:SDR family NAD(P)-dependent oxidoreductase n=1 Tax=Chitinophaga TaxID=79328 RepID=UPI0014555047|nr:MULTISPECIES: glucose 1-dehydrogenase [Chitinophaga]NLR60100.1 glucose 1-dehydrogenase [Chitinophaga polysaccharea]NLU94329.1 glucose 1-dehydrogenase [Chitinophaga sp. Ak27]
MEVLKNKVALVTGAGSGIGKCVAELYARNGASVVISDIDEKGGEAVAKAIQQTGGKAIFVKSDSSNPGDCEQLVVKALSEFNQLDIACNNAGIGGAAAPTGEYKLEEWQKVININLSGVFYGMRYQLPAMERAGGGVIVNMASILGAVGFAGSCAYVAAKHGVVGLTQAAAVEYSAKGIRINAVGPGFIETPLLTKHLSQEQMQALVGLHPIGRLGQPEEVAEMVLWLSSPQSSFVTGGYYPIDGAYLAR